MRARSPIPCVLALALLASCHGVETRADAGFFYSQVSGTIGVGLPAGESTAPAVVRADVGDGLGLDGGAASGYARLELASGPGSLAISGFQHDQRGDGAVDLPLGDTTVSIPVRSSLRLWSLKASANYAVLDTEHFRLSPGLAVDVVDLAMQTRAPLLAASERLDAQLWLPMLSLQSEARLGPVSAGLEAGGMTGRLIGSVSAHFDLDARVRVTPASGVEFFVGYRWIDLDARFDDSARDVTGSVRLQGWMVGGGLRF